MHLYIFTLHLSYTSVNNSYFIFMFQCYPTPVQGQIQYPPPPQWNGQPAVPYPVSSKHTHVYIYSLKNQFLSSK